MNDEREIECILSPSKAHTNWCGIEFFWSIELLKVSLSNCINHRLKHRFNSKKYLKKQNLEMLSNSKCSENSPLFDHQDFFDHLLKEAIHLWKNDQSIYSQLKSRVFNVLNRFCNLPRDPHQIIPDSIIRFIVKLQAMKE